MNFAKKHRLDLAVIYVLVLVPALLWLGMSPLADRFANLTVTLTSFGQLSGLLGMTMVALAMFFQIRLRGLATIMSKPTTITRVHHNLGVYGLVLLLLHPIFLAYRYVPISIQVAFNAIFVPTLVNFVGLVALILMIISMWVTLLLPRSYVHWKAFHLFFVLAYLFSLYHLLFTTSDTTTNPTLYWYMVLITLSGGLFFLIQKLPYLWKKYFVAKPQQ